MTLNCLEGDLEGRIGGLDLRTMRCLVPWSRGGKQRIERALLWELL